MGSPFPIFVRFRERFGPALMDAPGVEIYSAAIQLTGSDLFLQELDLTVVGIAVNGPFRVGFEFQHAGLPSVARDDDGIVANRNWRETSRRPD